MGKEKIAVMKLLILYLLLENIINPHSLINCNNKVIYIIHLTSQKLFY